MTGVRVAHYINQFFAGVGGEEAADHAFEIREGSVGPGKALEMAYGDGASIVKTLVCGDNAFQDDTDGVIAQILAALEADPVDVFVAGPAFNAGRYGVACASASAAVAGALGIPVVTGLYPESPAVEMFQDRITIVPTRDSAAGMMDAARAIARVSLMLATGEPLGPADEAGVIGSGARGNWPASEPAAARAVDMLLAKLAGEDFETEVPLPVAREKVAPADAVPDLSGARVALVTEGGLVPLDNPDRIESLRATKWASYPVSMLEEEGPPTVASIHSGFDTRWVNEDPNRIVPVDAARALEEAGVIGQLHDRFYVTVGTGMTVPNAERIGTEIVKALIEDGVQAAILTST